MVVKILLVFLIVVVAGVALFVTISWKPERSVDQLRARWAAAPSQFISLDGMDVHFRDEGPRSDPIPIVLLHGTGASLHTWEGWVQGLKPTHRVISIDRPGFGLTGPNPSGDYTMAYYVGFLGRFLDHLGVQRCILVGNSSGGQMAWAFAVAAPQRVSKLVLLAPAGYPRSTPLPTGLKIAMSPIGPFLLHILPRAAVEKSVRGTYGDPSKVTPEVVDRNAEIITREGDRAVLGETLRQAQSSEDSSQIRTITTPTLIIWGSKDTLIPVSDAEKFHADIAGSRLVILPGVGHLAQEEDPVDTLTALQRFLAEPFQ